MKSSYSKIISAVCTALLFATPIFLLFILITDGFNGAVKPSGGDMSENIGKACTSAIVVIASVLAMIVQAIAGLFSLGSTLSYKRKGSVYTSNAFCILFCVVAAIVYCFTLFAFADISNGSSAAKIVILALVSGFCADLFSIAACIIAMVVKGRDLRVGVEVSGDATGLTSFIIGESSEGLKDEDVLANESENNSVEVVAGDTECDKNTSQKLDN